MTLEPSIHEPEISRRLLTLARLSITTGLDAGEPLTDLSAFAGGPFEQPAATFVTLKKGGELRGCVGTLRPVSSLAESVAHNAFHAAFRDSRFPPLILDELAALHIEISVLGTPEPLAVATLAELLEALRPGVDGLILKEGQRGATFLPQVWASLPEPADFVAQLLRKGGWPAGAWSSEMRAHRYVVETVEEPD